jgi:hypothetical protein
MSFSDLFDSEFKTKKQRSLFFIVRLALADGFLPLKKKEF